MDPLEARRTLVGKLNHRDAVWLGASRHIKAGYGYLKGHNARGPYDPCDLDCPLQTKTAGWGLAHTEQPADMTVTSG